MLIKVALYAMMLVVLAAPLARTKDTNVFSKSGELEQVENAKKAALKGRSVLCAKSSDGEVVLCIPTSVKPQMLVDRRSADKVARVSDEIWMSFAGYAGDARYALKSAREFCLEYYQRYGSQPSVQTVSRHLGDLQHQMTFQGDGRPLGIQALIIGGDATCDDCRMFLADPSGELSSWKAFAIGKNADKFNKQLEESWQEGMSTVKVARMLARIAGVSPSSWSATHKRKLTETREGTGHGGREGHATYENGDLQQPGENTAATDSEASKSSVDGAVASDSEHGSELDSTPRTGRSSSSPAESAPAGFDEVWDRKQDKQEGFNCEPGGKEGGGGKEEDEEDGPAVDLYRFHVDQSLSGGRRMVSYYQSLPDLEADLTGGLQQK